MKYIIALLLSATVANSAIGDPPKLLPPLTPEQTATKPPPPPASVLKSAVVERNFNAKELNVDAFGVLSMPDITGKAQWGEGIGVNYFVTRGLGVGARMATYNNEGVFVDEYEARLIVRAPDLWDKVAPYGFVSGWYKVDDACAGAGVGAGVEYRFNKRFAAFGETGLRVAANCNDTTVSRNECGVTSKSSDAHGCDWYSTFGLRFILGFQ